MLWSILINEVSFQSWEKALVHWIHNSKLTLSAIFLTPLDVLHHICKEKKKRKNLPLITMADALSIAIVVGSANI